MGERRKTICIWGAWYSSRNVGDQAILICIMNLLRKEIPNSRFVVFSSNPGLIEREYGIESHAPKRQPFKLFSTLALSDLFIIGGGTPFYYEHGHLLYFLALVLVAKVFRTPIMIYSVSTQKIESKIGRWLIKFLLSQAKVVTVREPETIRRFRDIGFKKPCILTSDPSITMESNGDMEGREILRKKGVGIENRPLIGMCLHYFASDHPYRVHHYQRYENSLIEKHVMIMAEIADMLAESSTLVFIPMNTEAPDDDRVIAKKVIGLMKHANKVYSIETQFSPGEIVSLFKCLDLVVGVRLHSLVLSAAAGTPVFGISYAPKVTGFMEILEQRENMAHLGTEDIMNIKDRIRKLLSDLPGARKVIEIRIKELQRLAEENARRAKGLCRF